MQISKPDIVQSLFQFDNTSIPSPPPAAFGGTLLGPHSPSLFLTSGERCRRRDPWRGREPPRSLTLLLPAKNVGTVVSGC